MIVLIILAGVCAGLFIGFVAVDHSHKVTTKSAADTICVTVQDSLLLERLTELEGNCDALQDSLNVYKESLFVADYKLERIRYYVDIAAKGNNINYLRGWCYRVLNSEE